jgi:hypothetical protein
MVRLVDSSVPVGNGTKKTATMTFRIDENIVTKLRDEADNREISLNTLVNQILKRFVEWDLFEPKLGLIPMAKPLVVELFENMSENEIADIAKHVGKNTVRDTALFMKHKMDLESFLNWFETRMKASFVEVSHRIAEDGKHSYILKHDLGRNWSIYHKIILELIFNDVLGKRINDIIVSSTMLSFSVFET